MPPARASAAAPTDACTLLSQAQVSAATALVVGPGAHVTPTTLGLCIWRSPVRAADRVAIEIPQPVVYNLGKMGAQKNGVVVTPVADLGDDAYYLVVGDTVKLFFKKNGVAFAVDVFTHGSLDEKKAAELTLAQEALAKL
jgi:hypothetical protein